MLWLSKDEKLQVHRARGRLNRQGMACALVKQFPTSDVKAL